MNLQEIADLLRPLAKDRDKFNRRLPNFAWKMVQAIESGSPLNSGACESIISVLSDRYDARTVSLVKNFLQK